MSVLIVFLAAVCGCGGSQGPFAVQGQVVWGDDSPAKELANGTVQFELIADDPKARASGTGEIDEHGGFRLSSNVPAGKYRVAVLPVLEPDDPDNPHKTPLLDRRYQDLEKSKIEVNVEAKRNDNVVIKVEKAKKR